MRTDAIIGSQHVPLAGGTFQVFDVIMQPEAEFMSTKMRLASPAVQPLLQQGQMNTAYVVKDIRQFEVPDGTAGAAEMARAHFKNEFKLN